MSVEVKTPTREQFECSDFQFPQRERRSSVSVGEICHRHSSQSAGPSGGGAGHGTAATDDTDVKSWHSADEDQEPIAPRSRRGSMSRKRRSTDRSWSFSAPVHPRKRMKSRRSSEKERIQSNIVLPTKFLLGGSITDPLNLNSLCDEEVNRALNEKTPHSSPLPLPSHKQEVKVLIPPNINDPLNLNSMEDDDPNLLSPKSGKKKKKQKKRKSMDGGRMASCVDEKAGLNADAGEEVRKPLTIDADSHSKVKEETAPSGSLRAKLNKIIDEIVSPVIPQTSPKTKRRKRTSSECKSECSSTSRPFAREDSDKSARSHRSGSISGSRSRYRRQSSCMSSHSSEPAKGKPKEAKFIYGNYDRYYGYRNPDAVEDQRLACFRPEWIEGKDVLDVGCNAGHLTIELAKKFSPKKIVGMDIDPKLITSAKKNVRSILSKEKIDISKFPASLPLIHGPIAAPPVIDPKSSPCSVMFPHNMMFMQGNYVLERNELVDLQKEEYDTILFFSITKWMHLNWGDDGLKRAFRRVFRQLRPGGHLILEPQSWTSYKRRKKLTESIRVNYDSIRFKPDQFTEYLLSPAVGFSTCEKLEIPLNKSKGFQRPIFVYTKPDTAYATPYRTDSCAVTPSACSTPGQSSRPRYQVSPRLPLDASVITPCSTCSNTPYDTPSPGASPEKLDESSPDASSSEPSADKSCDSTEHGTNSEPFDAPNQDLSDIAYNQNNDMDLIRDAPNSDQD